MAKPTGYIIHEDSERVGIVTIPAMKPSAHVNAKTGRMRQVWILVRRYNPIHAIRIGADKAVCGNCPHRGESCYLDMSKAPLSVWRAWERGSYGFLPVIRYPEVFTGHKTRFGAYGDPTFLPLPTVRWIAHFSDGWTGYTHQWREPWAQVYRDLVMASADSAHEREVARAMGWRVFRVRRKSDSLMAGEISCPASEESGHRTQCVRCGLCNGARVAGDVRKDISIVVHGARKRKFEPIASRLIQIGGLS